MNFSKKSKADVLDSKRQSDKPFQQLFRTLNAKVTEENFQILNEDAKTINDAIISHFEQIYDLLAQREEQLNAENQNFEKSLHQLLTHLEDKLGQCLEQSLQQGVQNVDNWKAIAEKKMTYEKMHENLLQMKKSAIGFNFIAKASK